MSVPVEPTDDADATPTVQRKAFRLKQLHDVSRKPPTEGDSLVYVQEEGQWVPKNVTPGDNEITDAMIGERTVDDTVVPSANNGLLSSVLSGFGNLIKLITGKPNWFTPPAISLETLNVHAARHATGGADPLTPAQIGAATSGHGHADATTGASGFMSATDKTKLNGVATGATNTPTSGSIPTALSVADAGSAGASTSASRADHRHPMPPLATESQDGFISAASMVKVNAAALLSNVLPTAETVNATGSVGTNTLYAARADHRHDMPGIATASVSGFMSNGHVSKLDGIEDGATAGPALSSGTPDSLVAGQSGYSGSSTQAARSDHQHPTTNFVPNLPSVWDVLSSAYVLTTTYTNVSGLAITPNNNGVWLVLATIDIRCVGADTGQLMNFRLWYNSAEYGNSSYVAAATGERANVVVMGLVTTTNFSNITVQAKKTGGTGTSSIEVLGTKLIGFRLST